MRSRPILRRHFLAAFGAATFTLASPVAAQRAVSRADAVAAVVARSPALAVSAADTMTARGVVLEARAIPNPTLNLSATKDAPQRHIAADLPLDFPWLRSARIAGAQAGHAAAVDRFALARAAAAFDADTAYTMALVAQAHAALSRQAALAADSLRQAAELRRDAGDVSDLDVELATIAAGQAANLAAVDSLAARSALLDLQTLMGESAGQVDIQLADTLAVRDSVPLVMAQAGAPTPLAVAAAERSVAAADHALTAARRSVWGSASVQLGVDFHDNTQPGYLPVIGLAIPIPLFNRSPGAVTLAQAERDRARAELRVVQQASARDIARVRAAQEAALERVRRDRTLLASASRVEALSRTAYREGATPLATVLQAMGVARETRGAYVDDVGTASVAAAALRLLTTSSVIIQK
ncbi:MAG TPA: TolC family protein [Gemmatimonadaceae bacterium]|nr:TolC family protein [Gemmatimonadaceae bacterium]